jgi:hypothetical protein
MSALCQKRTSPTARFQLLNQTLALPLAPERAGDFSDVLPDVGEGELPRQLIGCGSAKFQLPFKISARGR